MILWVDFSVGGLCRTLLSIDLSLSWEVEGIASGSGRLRLVCLPSHIGSSSSLGVWGFLPEMESCISLWRLPIVGRVFKSVSLLEEVLPGSYCTVGVVADGSFCSLQRGNLLVHRVTVDIYLGFAPVVMRGLESSACWRRFVPFSLAALDGSCAGRSLVLCSC